MNFEQLGLIEPILRALREEGYVTPTPIQQQAIPLLLQGKDLLGCAQTGTGKTAAFAVPILQLLQNRPQPSKGRNRPIRSLILTPTRELAMQIGESFTAYGRHLPLRNLVIFGGVGQKPQTDALQRGVDILVATPGRLLDLMQQGFIALDQIEMFVLDEADRMLDMGFVHDVRRVLAKLPTERHSLFFSATMAPEILRLASGILKDPAHVEVTPVSTTAETVHQKVYFVEKKDKKNLLRHLLDDPAIETALVFTRTKHGANKLARDLHKSGVHAEAIHGNKSQTARVKALEAFKKREIRVLVATDIAARGIDIDELTHVVNFELPNVPETYVHRIGRTGRAGASGSAISFCDSEERAYLKDIQKLTGQQVPVAIDHPYESSNASPVPLPQAGETRSARNSRQKPARSRRPDNRSEQRQSKPGERKEQPAGSPRPQGRNGQSDNRSEQRQPASGERKEQRAGTPRPQDRNSQQPQRQKAQGEKQLSQLGQQRSNEASKTSNSKKQRRKRGGNQESRWQEDKNKSLSDNKRALLDLLRIQR
ncbi:MAG: DEAD/DEAH box helicase [Bacteroidetes bacterium]|nr:MAG: DEAD/DEAH box helicase [Bacteroidota bacterium]